MYRWRIQISSNDSELLSYLLAALKNSPHKLLVEDGYYYLVSSSFEVGAQNCDREPVSEKARVVRCFPAEISSRTTARSARLDDDKIA